LDNITYIGESLWPGQLGHFCIVLGFVGALFAAVAYAFQANDKNIGEQSNRWLTRCQRISHHWIGFLCDGQQDV